MLAGPGRFGDGQPLIAPAPESLARRRTQWPVGTWLRSDDRAVFLLEFGSGNSEDTMAVDVIEPDPGTRATITMVVGWSLMKVPNPHVPVVPETVQFPWVADTDVIPPSVAAVSWDAGALSMPVLVAVTVKTTSESWHTTTW